MVISYDWHPHDHCSFVESASEGKVAIKDCSRYTGLGLRVQALWTEVLNGPGARPNHCASPPYALALNPKPETLNPKTLNPTLQFEPATLSGDLVLYLRCPAGHRLSLHGTPWLIGLDIGIYRRLKNWSWALGGTQRHQCTVEQ